MSPRLLLSLTALLAASHSYAKEYPIGEPQQCGGVEHGSEYLPRFDWQPTVASCRSESSEPSVGRPYLTLCGRLYPACRPGSRSGHGCRFDAC